MPVHTIVPSPWTKNPVYLPRIANNTNEDNIIKDVRNLFRLTKQLKLMRLVIIILTTKLIVIKVKRYESKNTLKISIHT